MMGNKCRKRLFVTIDTEADADIHWRKGKPVSFSSVLYGIPEYYRPMWDSLHVKPIYFVSPEVLENEEACNILKKEVEKGAVLGAHLHADFIAPGKKELGTVENEMFPCNELSKEEEYQKIKNLKELVEEKIGITPRWYRAARYGADYETLDVLAELGFRFDSSFTPGIDWTLKGGPNHSKIKNRAFQVKAKSGTIVEVPITITGKRFGIIGRLLPNKWLFYKWLRPSHMFYLEQKSMIRHLSDKGAKNIVMMFHSMEVMINKTPYVRNKLMQKWFLWKIKKTIMLAQKYGYKTD